MITGIKVFFFSHFLLGCYIREDMFSAHCYLSVISTFPVSHDGWDAVKRVEEADSWTAIKHTASRKSAVAPAVVFVLGCRCYSSIKAARSAHTTTCKCQPSENSTFTLSKFFPLFQAALCLEWGHVVCICVLVFPLANTLLNVTRMEARHR